MWCEDVSSVSRAGVDSRCAVTDAYMNGKLRARRSWQVGARVVAFGGGASTGFIGRECSWGL